MSFRELQPFPTRNYPYGAGGRARAALQSNALVSPVLPNTLYRHVIGLDESGRPMTADELQTLDDPFGRLLRSGRPFPLSLRHVLEAVDAMNGTPDALPNQLVFLVGDGGHIAWTPETDTLSRFFRFAIARGDGDFPLLISSSTAADSTANAAFLQVVGWDATHEVFRFYERRDGTFFWAGMSTHALERATRGKGPFDSHVNGGLVMKELRMPWVHWHAPLAGINAEAFAPNDRLTDDPLFKSRVTAERLESEVVRPGIQRWNAARVRKAVDADGVWRHVRYFLRQVLTSTTVNVATSDIASHLLRDETPVRPPLSFFLNRDTLFDTLGLEPDDPSVADIAVPGRLYRQWLSRYDVHRFDGTVRIEGDSHFAFLIPEPAFEDTHLVDVMLQAGLLTTHFAAALSMVDFTNPVFSERRSALLRYVPEEVRGGAPGERLANETVAAVRAAVSSRTGTAAEPTSPEREFLANWDTESFDAVFRQRITDYLVAAKSGMADEDAVDGWLRLAAYRRRRFRARRLAEFPLTIPRNNIPRDAPVLEMTSRGRVAPI